MKTISDLKAVQLCKKWLDIAIRKKVILRPGTFLDTRWEAGKEVYYACALGGIEHAIAKGKERPEDWNDIADLAERANHGVSVNQLAALEAGFENRGVTTRLDEGGRTDNSWHRALYKLGQQYREKALKAERERT